MVNAITNKDITQMLLRICTMKILGFCLALVNINFLVHSTKFTISRLADTSSRHIGRFVYDQIA